MPQTTTAATGTWTEEEIRQQPASWIRSLNNIDSLRSSIDSFLTPLLRKHDLRIVLTGAGTSAFIGDIIAPWLASHTGKTISAVPTTDLVTNPMDYFSPAHPLLLVSFARSGNSPESVAAVELANQFVPECYHLSITCNEAGSLYQTAVDSDNAYALLMPAETHDRGFAMTSSITTMMASCLAVFAPETINSHTFRDVADRCQAILTSLGDFSHGVFGSEPWKRIVYLGSGGLQGAARESALKVLELTAGKLAAFYDSPTGFRHRSRWSTAKRWWWCLSPALRIRVSTIWICWLSYAAIARLCASSPSPLKTIRSLKRVRTFCCHLHVRLSIWNRRSAS